MGNLNFSTDGIDTGAKDSLPPSWYEVVIRSAELQKRKAGDDMLVKLDMRVTERHGAKISGTKIEAWLCIDHPQDQTRTIARQRLASIAKALGKSAIADTDELVGGMLEVRTEPKTGEYSGNNVLGYRACRDAVATPAPTAATPAAAPARKATPPWGR